MTKKENTFERGNTVVFASDGVSSFKLVPKEISDGRILVVMQTRWIKPGFISNPGAKEMVEVRDCTTGKHYDDIPAHLLELHQDKAV